MKADIKEAYKMVPVNPAAQHLLGLQGVVHLHRQSATIQALLNPKNFQLLLMLFNGFYISRGSGKVYIIFNLHHYKIENLLVTSFQRLGRAI